MSRLVTRMPREIKLGDVIADGTPKGLKVTKIEHYACSKRDTHVNGSACYPWSVPIGVFTN